jgi:hypothetical protein
LRAIYFASTGPAQGRFNETLPNCSDVWYGGAFSRQRVQDKQRQHRADRVVDPVSSVHGGVSLRTDDQYHVVRGNIANPAVDTNVGPAFSLRPRARRAARQSARQSPTVLSGLEPVYD